MEESRKRRSPCKCCTKEPKKDVPNLKNEHSLFEREISLKIEEFRLARSNWIASRTEDEIMKANITEGLNESKVYRGRCICLRKIGLKTTRLRKHYQTVKPLRYFTFKSEISDTAASQSKYEIKRQDNQWDQLLTEQDSFLEQFEEEAKLKDKKQEIWEEKESEIKRLVGEELKEGVKEKKKKRKGPSQKAIENLKASKQADRLLETCKCNDGKEVTVVIKGFCLCDKGNLKTFKLNNIDNDYRKLEKSKPELEREEVEPHLVDSIEFHKKQIERKLTMVKENEEEKQEIELPRSKSTKGVSFGPHTVNEWKSEKNGQKKEEKKGLDEKDQKEGKNEQKREEEEKMKERDEKERRREEEEKMKERDEKVQKREEEEKTKEKDEKEQKEGKKEQKEDEIEDEERCKGNKPRSKEEEERCREKKAKERKKREDKEEAREDLLDELSFITLFQNSLPKKSDMALTREQFDKLKEDPRCK